MFLKITVSRTEYIMFIFIDFNYHARFYVIIGHQFLYSINLNAALFIYFYI